MRACVCVCLCLSVYLSACACACVSDVCSTAPSRSSTYLYYPRDPSLLAHDHWQARAHTVHHVSGPLGVPVMPLQYVRCAIIDYRSIIGIGVRVGVGVCVGVAVGIGIGIGIGVLIGINHATDVDADIDYYATRINVDSGIH